MITDAERHTGSKWLTDMVSGSLGINNLWKYNWKHWFPEWDKIENTDTSSTLFIVLSRDPYEWVAAMNQTPHHAVPRLKGLDIDTFIKEEWECEWTQRDVPWIDESLNFTEMMNERNPDTGERIKNVIELRNYKNREFLLLKEKVEHVYYVRYEDMLISPVKIINEMILNYPVRPIRPINPQAKKAQQRNLTPYAIQFINDNINWDYEKELGYKKNR